MENDEKVIEYTTGYLDGVSDYKDVIKKFAEKNLDKCTPQGANNVNSLIWFRKDVEYAREQIYKFLDE